MRIFQVREGHAGEIPPEEGNEVKMAKEYDELDQAIKSLTREVSRLKAEEESSGEIDRGYNRAVKAVMESRDTRAIRSAWHDS